MTSYESALRAMEHLLDAVGETHWRDWIRQDLREWEATGTAGHHLSAYGGMGSFTDVVLCRANGHQITGAQAPWVERLFQDLQSVCYYLANHVGKRTSTSALVRSMGTVGTSLDGWRCLHCGHREVTPKDIDRYLAYHRVRHDIIAAYKGGVLGRLIDQVLALDFPDHPEARRVVADAARTSGISVREREGWMRPCPKCRSNDTAVCYWAKARRHGAFRLVNRPFASGTT